MRKKSRRVLAIGHYILAQSSIQMRLHVCTSKGDRVSLPQTGRCGCFGGCEAAAHASKCSRNTVIACNQIQYSLNLTSRTRLTAFTETTCSLFLATSCTNSCLSVIWLMWRYQYSDLAIKPCYYRRALNTVYYRHVSFLSQFFKAWLLNSFWDILFGRSFFGWKDIRCGCRSDNH